MILEIVVVDIRRCTVCQFGIAGGRRDVRNVLMAPVTEVAMIYGVPVVGVLGACTVLSRFLEHT